MHTQIWEICLVFALSCSCLRAENGIKFQILSLAKKRKEEEDCHVVLLNTVHCCYVCEVDDGTKMRGFPIIFFSPFITSAFVNKRKCENKWNCIHGFFSLEKWYCIFWAAYIVVIGASFLLESFYLEISWISGYGINGTYDFRWNCTYCFASIVKMKDF